VCGCENEFLNGLGGGCKQIKNNNFGSFFFLLNLGLLLLTSHTSLPVLCVLVRVVLFFKVKGLIFILLNLFIFLLLLLLLLLLLSLLLLLLLLLLLFLLPLFWGFGDNRWCVGWFGVVGWLVLVI
jgi:hypothetical protein